MNRENDDTGIMDWFLFDLIYFAIGLLGGGATIAGFLANPIQIGSIIGGSVFATIALFVYILLCAFTNIFPSGIKTYCQYNIIKLIIGDLILLLLGSVTLQSLIG